MTIQYSEQTWVEDTLRKCSERNKVSEHIQRKGGAGNSYPIHWFSNL